MDCAVCHRYEKDCRCFGGPFKNVDVSTPSLVPDYAKTLEWHTSSTPFKSIAVMSIHELAEYIDYLSQQQKSIVDYVKLHGWTNNLKENLKSIDNDLHTARCRYQKLRLDIFKASQNIMVPVFPQNMLGGMAGAMGQFGNSLGDIFISKAPETTINDPIPSTPQNEAQELEDRKTEVDKLGLTPPPPEKPKEPHKRKIVFEDQ